MYKFQKPSRPINRVFIHCSASDNPAHDNVATIDEWHKQRGWSGIGYHLFIRKSGFIEIGRDLEKTPAAQSGHNRATIAICLHGLDVDKFTDEQKEALQSVCSQINAAYNRQLTFHGHKEVAAKACPVLDYKDILELDAVGRLGLQREESKVKAFEYGDLSAIEAPEAASDVLRTLRLNSTGSAVKALQKELVDLGYHVGAVDGHFGKMTRTAVLSFQADNHLVEDGVVGRATYEALDDAQPKEISHERASKSVLGLAVDGSRIAQASMAQGLMGTGVTVGGAVTALEKQTGLVTRLTDSLGVYRSAFDTVGPWVGLIVAVVGAVVVLQAIKAGKARRDDHRTGRTA